MNDCNQPNTSLKKQQITTSIKSPKINSYRLSKPSPLVGNSKHNTSFATSHKTTTTTTTSSLQLIGNATAAAAVAGIATTDTLSINTNTIYTSSTNNNDGQYNNTYPNQTQTSLTPRKTSIRNFASITANYNSPKRGQALVFNSIDGVPQK